MTSFLSCLKWYNPPNSLD